MKARQHDRTFRLHYGYGYGFTDTDLRLFPLKRANYLTRQCCKCPSHIVYHPTLHISQSLLHSYTPVIAAAYRDFLVAKLAVNAFLHSPGRASDLSVMCLNKFWRP